MQKFIHANFELDLSDYRVDRVVENQWFSDQLFTKYTFPFELKITDEINRYFGALLDFNIEEPDTYYRGYLFIDGTHEEAVLEILEVVDRVAQIEVRYGFEELPNWETQLSELPLYKETLEEDLQAHAPSIIDQTYPAVNYNFPMVFTDSFSPEDDRWLGFEGAINNYVDGAFLENEFDTVENLTYNKNIMIPFPYLMHVLMAGFSDAGYTLMGDILNDSDINRMLLVRESEEYINARLEGEEIVTDIKDYDSLYNQVYRYGIFNINSATRQLAIYEDTYTFPFRGRYKISGVVYLRRQFSDASAELFYKGRSIKRFYQDYIRQNSWSERVRYVDIYVDVDNLAELLTLKSRQLPNAYVQEEVVSEAPLWDLTITPIAIYDEQDVLIPALVSSEKIDLTKVVPSITFGALVKAIKNWKNMELRIDGSDIYMDYIEPQLNVTGAKDFSAFNQKVPRRKFNQGDSFLLSFKEVDNENYSPEPVYVDIDGMRTSAFASTENTKEIEIDAVVFPIVFRNGRSSALSVDDGEGNICVVLYYGDNATLNLAQEVDGIMLPSIYEEHWSKWIQFRLRSQAFTTAFNCPGIFLDGLTVRDKVFMYNNYHLIRTLNKTNVPGTSTYEVELELESLK